MPTHGDIADADIVRGDADASIEREATRVLNDPLFLRSPVLSRLLAYLVTTTVEGRTVKAFEVAVDGLGRSHMSSADTDSYARVAVARLRKALSAYYAMQPRAQQLHIPAGSYKVRLARGNIGGDQPAAPDRPAPKRETPPEPPASSIGAGGKRPGLWLGAVAGAALAALVAFLAGRGGQDASAWSVSNFPSVSVVLGPADAVPAPESCRQNMIVALGAYTGIRLLEGAKAKPDYELRLEESTSGPGGKPTLSLVHRGSGRIVWSDSPAGDGPCLDEAEMERAAYSIASPGGELESFARRQDVPADTPYGCWLRFTESVQTYNTLDDRTLSRCAEDWYAANASHPAAAMLYGWTLTDEAAFGLTRDNREERLERALAVIRSASVVHSGYPSLGIARMRAHSFLGRRAQVVKDANEVLAEAHGNRVLVAMAGAGLAMWNDPRGERVLLGLGKEPVQRLPSEYVGLFVAAMMRDDVAAAGQQLAGLEETIAEQPPLLLLKAAHFSRAGKRGMADDVLDTLKQDRRVLIAGPDRLIDRLPMAPEVRARLKQWLAA